MLIMGKSLFLVSSVSVTYKFSEICLPQAKIERFYSSAPASMQIYLSKRKRLHKKGSTPTGLVWNTNMAAVSLRWNTNMAAVGSCRNTLK